MQTVVIRITEAGAGGGFDVELLTSKTGDPSKLASVPGAVAKIPATLEPETPVADYNGVPLTVAAVLQQYETEGDRSPAYAQIGEFLYRLLARGKVESEWRKLREENDARTLIDIESKPSLQDLHRLPWELVFDPVAATHLFLDKTNPVMRGEAKRIDDANAALTPQAKKLAFADDDWPLRVLVVYGAGPEYAGEGTGIGAKEELEALENLFADSRFDVEYEILEHPSRPYIIEKCASIEPHILHFIGHAQAGAAPLDHRLMIWGPGGDADTAGKGYEYWTLFDIRNDLQTIPLRLAVLNGCRTAGVAPGAAPAPATKVAPFDNITESMLQRGTLGVVGMQGDIPGDVAAAFSRALYEGLVKGKPVDVAVQMARVVVSQLAAKFNYVERKDWSFPMLRTRVMPDLVLPRRQQQVLVRKFDKDRDRFVGHLASRRLVRQTIRPKLAAKPAKSPTPAKAKKPKPDANGAEMKASPHLVAIVGDEAVGKSHLVQWCAELFSERDMHVAKVQFDGADSIDLLDTLRWIRDGRRPKKGEAIPEQKDAPLPAASFRRFTQKLNARLHGTMSVESLPEPAGEVVDDGTPFPASKSSDLAFVEDTCHDFRLALEESAKTKPIVLILDQLEKIEMTTRTDPLVKYLLAPIARGSVVGVCAIVVARTSDFSAIQIALGNAGVQASVVDVSYFKLGEYHRVTRHLCQQWSPGVYALVRTTVENLLAVHQLPNGWKGGEVLKSVDIFCQQFKKKK